MINIAPNSIVIALCTFHRTLHTEAVRKCVRASSTLKRLPEHAAEGSAFLSYQPSLLSWSTADLKLVSELPLLDTLYLIRAFQDNLDLETASGIRSQLTQISSYTLSELDKLSRTEAVTAILRGESAYGQAPVRNLETFLDCVQNYVRENATYNSQSEGDGKKKGGEPTKEADKEDGSDRWKNWKPSEWRKKNGDKNDSETAITFRRAAGKAWGDVTKKFETLNKKQQEKVLELSKWCNLKWDGTKLSMDKSWCSPQALNDTCPVGSACTSKHNQKTCVQDAISSEDRTEREELRVSFKPR